jgi:hypothetical protein
MSLLQLAEWLEATPAGVMVRESAWGFQVLVAMHLLGLSLSVGLLVWFDLRLLGISMPRVPVSAAYRRLMPWILAGFAVMFVSGGLLLTGFATAAYGNVYFRLKVLAILLAGVNAAVYHLVTERQIGQWDTGVRPSGPARAAGLVSVLLWASVILAGRMMSYTMF